MKKYNTFLLIMILSIFFVVLLSCIGLIIFDSKISWMLIYIIVYLFLTIFFITKEYSNIINIKSLFVAFYTIMIGISPVVYYINNSNNYHFSCDYQFLIIIIGYIFLLLGFYLPSLFKKKKSTTKPDIIDNDKLIPHNKINTFGILLFLISTLMNFVYIYMNKALFFGSNLESNRILAMSSNGLILLICGLNIISLGIIYENLKRQGKKLTLFWLLFILTCLIYIIRGSRTAIFNLLLLIILIRNYYKPFKPKTMLMFLCGFIVILSLLQVFRTNMSNSNTKFNVQIYNNLQVNSINLNYIFNAFPSSINFQYGKTFLINIKMLLPGDDDDFTLWLKKSLKLDFSGGGVTPTILGEAYMNFGYFGIILIMFLTGRIAKSLNNRYLNNNKDKVWICYLTILLCSTFRSGYANIEINLLVLCSLYIFYIIFLRKKGEAK